MTGLDFDGVRQQVAAAIAAAPDADAAMRSAVGLLKARVPHYGWVGIYLMDGNELVLGPYVGKPSPHTRIPLDRGICGAGAREKATIVVDDVNADPRYLACSLETRSEIVVPVMAGDTVLGEIDIDSDTPSAFGPADQTLLEALAPLLGQRIRNEQSTPEPRAQSPEPRPA